MGHNFINQATINVSTLCKYDTCNGYASDFSSNGNFDGWDQPSGLHTYGVWNNFLFATLIGISGYVGRSNVFVPVPAEDFYTVKIAMKFHPTERVSKPLPTTCKLMWRTLSSANWSSNKSMEFPLYIDDKWHEYVLNMGEHSYWLGDVNDLRFYPTIDGQEDDEFFIRSIKITSVATYRCLNGSCNYHSDYTHNCIGAGRRAFCKSAQHNSDYFNISDDSTIILDINGYGEEIIKLHAIENGSGEYIATKLAFEISKVGIGGYSEVLVVYIDGQFIIYSGTITDDSSVVIKDGDFSRQLKFFNKDGAIFDSMDGKTPASGFKPASSFHISTFRLLELFDNDFTTEFRFDPFGYAIEGGRSDWVENGAGFGNIVKGAGIGGEPVNGIPLPTRINRFYSKLDGAGKTLIDFTHPFNASGRIKKLFIACTLDVGLEKDPDSRYQAWEYENGRIELSGAKVKIFRPKRDGLLDTIFSADIVDRDRSGGALYSEHQETTEIDCDVWVNKGDLIGVYNVNLYLGKTISSTTVPAMYFSVTGEATGLFNPGSILGDGDFGLMLYARSDYQQSSLLIDVDLGTRTSVSNINVVGETESINLEYNIASCQDINWQINLFGGEHKCKYLAQVAPLYYPVWKTYTLQNIAYGTNLLSDNKKYNVNGKVADSFTCSESGGVIPMNPKYFYVNGDGEWLGIYHLVFRALYGGSYDDQHVVEFEEDPIAFDLFLPYNKSKIIYKSVVYFKEIDNFRNFSLSTYNGPYGSTGNAEDSLFIYIPEYTAIILDGKRTEKDGAGYDSLKDYLFKNPTNILPETIKTGGPIDYGDGFLVTNYEITNNTEYLQAINTDWQTISHEFEPVECCGFRIYCDLHHSTKINEMEVYGISREMSTSLIGGTAIRYSFYSDIWWDVELNETADGSVGAYIGDTPRYITIALDPITSSIFKDINLFVDTDSVYAGEKGCEYELLLDNTKVNTANEASVIDIKNVYDGNYDLYVDIATNDKKNSGLVYHSVMNNAESISNPEVGSDGRYTKQNDYPLVNVNGNVAINCDCWGLKNLIDQKKVYYSYTDGFNWKTHLNCQMVVDKNQEGTYDTDRSYMSCVIKESDISYKMWYGVYDGAHYRIMYATSIEGVIWTGHQMVLNYNTEGTYDTVHVSMPCVVKESDTSYKMWYSGSDGTNYRIIYTTSTDGITWSGHQMVLDIGSEGTYDTVHAYMPSVIKDGNTYKMWYSGSDGINQRIIYATSTDGITWTGHQMVLNINNISYDAIHVFAPCVIKESNIFYKIWYSAHDGTRWRILYAESVNGVIWTDHKLVINHYTEEDYGTTDSYAPCVIKESDTFYKMWYSGYKSYWSILYTELESSLAAPDKSLSFENMTGYRSTVINLPTLIRDRYWKFSWDSDDVSMKVYEAYAYKDGKLMDVVMYENARSGPMADEAAYLQDGDLISGSFAMGIGSYDVTTGGVATATHTWGSNYPSKAIDDNESTFWSTDSGDFGIGDMWQVRLTQPVVVGTLRTKHRADNSFAGFELQASNDGIIFVKIAGPWTRDAANDDWETYGFSNNIAYLYYRLVCTVVGPDTRGSLYEVEMFTVGNSLGIDLGELDYIDSLILIHEDATIDPDYGSYKLINGSFTANDVYTRLNVRGIDGQIKDYSYYEYDILTTGSGVSLGQGKFDVGTSNTTGVKFSGYDDSYISIQQELGMVLESHMFTIDFFVKVDTLPAVGEVAVLAGVWGGDLPERVMDAVITNDSTKAWLFLIRNTGTLCCFEFWVNHAVRYGSGSGSVKYTTYGIWAEDVPIVCGTHYHLGMDRNPQSGKGETVRAYINGSFYNYVNDLVTYYQHASSCYFPNTGLPIKIGKGFCGVITEFRYTLSGLNDFNIHYHPQPAQKYLSSQYWRQHQRLFKVNIETSTDNIVYNDICSVDTMFNTDYYYYVKGSRYNSLYDTQLLIDLDKRHDIQLLRSYGKSDALSVSLDHFNSSYSSENISNPHLIDFGQEISCDDVTNSFVGADYSDVNIGMWKIGNAGNNSQSKIYIKNNMLYMKNAETTATTMWLESKFVMKGFHDIQLDYILDEYTSSTSWFVYLYIMDSENTSNWSVRRHYTGQGHQYETPGGTNTSYFSTNELRGSMNFCRWQDTYSTFGATDNGTWRYLRNTTTDSAEARYFKVKLYLKIEDNCPITSVFLNLKVNYVDGIYLPQAGSNYNDARWCQIRVPNDETRYVRKLGIYPDLTTQLGPGGGYYNSQWDFLGEAVTNYSEGVNIALGAIVSGSSVFSSMPLANLTDGKVGSDFYDAWGSDQIGNPVINVDLGKIYSIYRVKIYHGYDVDDDRFLVKNYTISYSPDDITYTDIFNVTGNTSFERTHDLVTPVNARYVKITITNFDAEVAILRETDGSLQTFEGAVIREIEINKYYGYSVINSEEYPIIAINMKDQFYLNSHSLVGIDSEDTSIDWNNSESNFSYSDQVWDNPSKITFSNWGTGIGFNQWVVLKRDTATNYNSGPDYLKHLVMSSETVYNPCDNPWWWHSNLSTLSRDFSQPVEYGISTLKIEYPISDGLDMISYEELEGFGVDQNAAWRDGLFFRFRVDDVNNLDFSEGYFYFAGRDATPEEKDVEYRWNLSTVSGAISTGWSNLILPFKYADEVIYTDPLDADEYDPRIPEDILFNSLGVMFKGVGNALTLHLDGFQIRRCHFNEYSAFDKGLYLVKDDFVYTPIGEFNPSYGTIEFWLRPDYNLFGRDFYNVVKTRALFHFANNQNDVFGAAFTINGLEVYRGNVIQGTVVSSYVSYTGVELFDKVTHFAFVYSNNGKKIESDSSTLRIYMNGFLVAKSYDTWGIQDKKHFNFILGGNAPIGLRVTTVHQSSSIDGVISNFKIYNYCKVSFSGTLQNIEEENVNQLFKADELIEISNNNLTFFKVGSPNLPLLYEEVQSGKTVKVYVKTVIPKGLTGKEKRTSNLIISWNVAV